MLAYLQENLKTMNARPLADSSASQDDERIPLQVRLLRQEVRAIKVAAAENDQTISDFMLNCFRCWQGSRSTGRSTAVKAKR